MKSLKKSKFIYSIITAFISCILVLTGCSNSLSNKIDNNNNSDEIVIKGTVSVPTAMPSSFRSAYTSYSTSLNNQIQIFAMAEINGQVVTKTTSVTASSNFELYIPKKNATWIIYAQMCDENGIPVMESQEQTKTVTAADDAVTVDPFCLSVIDGSEQDGSVKLKFYKDNDNITKIKWTLKPCEDYIQLDQSKKSGFIEFDPAENGYAYLEINEIPAGLYDAKFYFVNSNDMCYGPVTDKIFVAPCFVTDTWFGQDTFISSAACFTVPSIDNIKKLFPNATWSKPVTGDIALLWNYDITTLKPTYTVHSVQNNTVSSTGYPLAAGVNIKDVFIDFETNDMYVLTKENTVIKYSASSGYSESYINSLQNSRDNIILTVAANNEQAYVLCYNEKNKNYTIAMFNENYDNFEYVDDIDVKFDDNASNYYNPYSFKMSLCDGYLFVAYEVLNSLWSGDPNYNPPALLVCNVFDVDNISNGGIWYEFFHQEYMELHDLGIFTLNDIKAVANGNDIPDLYLLLGQFTIARDDARSYGGIIKISTKDGDSSELDTDYGNDSLRGLYYEGDRACYSTPDSASASCFYNPVKFTGIYNGNYLIADDGATIEGSSSGKPPVLTIDNAENKDRLVSVNLTSNSFSQFGLIAPVSDISFNNGIYPGMGLGSNYSAVNFTKVETQQGNYSPYAKIDGDLMSFVEQVNIELHKKQSNGWIDYDVITELPSTSNEKLYFITNPSLPNATYEAVLYCNGRDINKDYSGNDLPAMLQYYTIDSTEGSIQINRPLPVAGNYYLLEVIVNVPTVVDGITSTMHYDNSIQVFPGTTLEIDSPATLDKLNDCLNSFLMSDIANVKVSLSPSSIQDGSTVLGFIDAVVEHFRSQSCPCLTLDFSEITGIDEIPAGTFGIDCYCLKLPFKTGIESGATGNYQLKYKQITVKKGAFSKDGVNFQGELVFSNDLEEFESGAFAVPPRKIQIEDVGTGYVNSQPNDNIYSHGKPKFYLMTVNSNNDYSSPDMLYKMQNDAIVRIVTCTKRNEPFDLNLSLSMYSGVSQIDENAFKGLPIKTVNLGSIPKVSRGAFEGTAVTDVYARIYIDHIGSKAFPKNTNIEIEDFDPNEYQWYFYVYSSENDLETLWAKSANEFNFNSSSEIPLESIIGKINGDEQCFVILKHID